MRCAWNNSKYSLNCFYMFWRHSIPLILVSFHKAMVYLYERKLDHRFSCCNWLFLCFPVCFFCFVLSVDQDRLGLYTKSRFKPGVATEDKRQSELFCSDWWWITSGINISFAHIIRFRILHKIDLLVTIAKWRVMDSECYVNGKDKL